MTNYQFTPLHDDEYDAARQILVDATHWLLSKGIRQWLEPLPDEIYRKRQAAGENYALRVDGNLAAVVTLMDYHPAYWAEYLPETPQIWMRTLATSRAFAGQNLGEVTVQHVVEHVRAGLKPGEKTHIYIDCLYGFLPQYYARLGFETMARKLFTAPMPDYDGVLMRLPVQRA